MRSIAAGTRRRGHPRRVRWPITVLAVAVSAMVMALSVWLGLRALLPQLDGTLPLTGLRAPVTVLRDRHGVPTLRASSLADLYLAQGYVTAQDRLWQMDELRRLGAGELAEVFGPIALPIDREQRILGLETVARRSLALASPQERVFLDRYALGVNAFIASHPHTLPLEFHLLRYAPRPWRAEDSLLLAGVMSKNLNYYTVAHALDREWVIARAGAQRAADLYVNRSAYDRLPWLPPDASKPLPGPGSVAAAPAAETAVPVVPRLAWLWRPQLLSRTSPSLPGEQPSVDGSNAWAVAGSHTASGRPMLSNDMHLGYQVPGLWYEIHLTAGAVDVAGVSLPGVPGVIVGHNQRIAWGFTNAMAAVTDLYVETFNARHEYLTPAGWRTPATRIERIHVRGRPDVRLTVTLTRHGPLISDLLPGEQRALALSWTLYEGVRMPFFDLDRAQNWQQFRAALTRLDAPALNAVYADVDGHIGFQVAGRIPLRLAGDGSVPVRGADDACAWRGDIPFAQLPGSFDPPSGVIASANGRVTGANYPYPISSEWEAPWRQARIAAQLQSARGLQPADLLALQNDVASPPDWFAAQRLAAAVLVTPDAPARARRAARLLRAWDGRMSLQSVGATLATRSELALTQQLLEPVLGDGWQRYRTFASSVWLDDLLHEEPARWLPPGFRGYSQLYVSAVQAAVSASDAPADVGSWRWGLVHRLAIRHPLLDRVPLLRRWAQPGVVALPGGAHTLKQITTRVVPSERLTVDLADLDRSTLNGLTGQSGQIGSPYYLDQWPAWSQGTSLPLAWSGQAVNRAARHRLVLQPAP